MSQDDLITIKGEQHKCVDKIIVEYPVTETDKQRRERIARGEQPKTYCYSVVTAIPLKLLQK